MADGDRVLISCITACGRCQYCRQGHYGQCLGGGGWILGHLIDGTQAEYVRVPFADLSVHQLPDNVTDEAALMLADIVPTAYEVGVLNGQVSPGDTVVIVGAGPIGLAAIMTAKLFSPSRIDRGRPAPTTAEGRSSFGADHRARPDDDAARRSVRSPVAWVQTSRSRRSASRTPSSCAPGWSGPAERRERRCARRAGDPAPGGSVDQERHHHDRPGRHVLHAGPALHARFRAAADPEFITHHFGLDEMTDAYQVFGDAAGTGALKVALVRS